ncbi:hypothetical protein RJT34_09475 [Clitoria ternatea]|uniref:Protein kinase domain-containing protein n=1 Tax=Clitoria ternatea TaxID=43366 RepID=A0AAN9K6Z2_CLITE
MPLVLVHHAKPFSTTSLLIQRVFFIEALIYTTQVLLQLRTYLEYPTSPQIWENYKGDLCNIPSSLHASIKCDGSSVTELKIMGDKGVVMVDKFNGFAVTNQTLSMIFSIDSFVTTLTRLSLLQVLDMSLNFLYGSIPPRIVAMVELHTLTLDGNYLNNTMPDWFESLSNLSVLSLKNNHLKGSFPSSLCKIKSLAAISLSQNELSGGLPDLTALSRLHVLDLRENHLDSELPLMPKAVVTILLSKNSFSGEIPIEFGELGQLQHLDLLSNQLSEMPPPALFSLPNISYLNLATNDLSGSFPQKVECGTKLGFVDISSNKLDGELPSCLASTSGKRVVKYDGNCLFVNSQHLRQGPYCKEGRNKFWKWQIVVGVSMIIVIALTLSAFGVFFYRKYHSMEMYGHDMLPKVAQDNSTTGVSSEFLASVSKLENGSYVMIQCVTLSKKCPKKNVKARLDLLSKLRHPNLVSLLGHCIDGDEQDDSSGLKLHLIYEYMPNDNFRTYLSEFSSDKILIWSDRLAILIGVAKAVHFLHTRVIPGCFRNQLKTNNILLDEHHIPKLSDYGMSMIVKEIEYLEAKGENPKSCQRENLEDDVYNFGLILYESLVGPIASEKGKIFFLDEKVLSNEIKCCEPQASFDSQDGRRGIVDPVVLTTSCQESLSIAISITTKCISADSSSRPSFEDVLWNLQYATQVQATADAEQKSDSAS